MPIALAVLDMQKGMFGTSSRVKLLPRLIASVNRALAAATELGWLIIEIRTEWLGESDPWSLRSQSAPELAFAAEPTAADSVDGLVFPNGHDVVIKARHSAFLWTNLETRLRRKQVTRLFLAGVWLDGSVGQTAIDGYERDFDTAVLIDAVASMEDERNQLARPWTKGLSNIRRMSVAEAVEQDRVPVAC